MSPDSPSSTRVCPACTYQGEEQTCPECGVKTLSAAAFEKEDPTLGKVFAERYEVLDVLGRGGFGAVYRARQLSMGREVALKIMRGSGAPSITDVQRFYREMKISAAVVHPNTVQVYDFGHTEEGELYLAMELLRGRTLGQVLEDEGKLDEARSLHVASQIAKALGAAHSQGVIHRDLKPDNIFLLEVFGDPNFVKVLDFGIARYVHEGGEEATRLTSAGLVIGTPPYMAPEQLRGETLDARCDLYALGMVLYRMVTGVMPYRQKNLPDMLHAKLFEPLPLPSKMAPLSGGVENVILELLVSDREARVADARQAIGLLEQAGKFLEPPGDGLEGGGTLPQQSSLAGKERGEPEAETLSVSAPQVSEMISDSSSGLDPLPEGAGGTEAEDSSFLDFSSVDRRWGWPAWVFGALCLVGLGMYAVSSGSNQDGGGPSVTKAVEKSAESPAELPSSSESFVSEKEALGHPVDVIVPKTSESADAKGMVAAAQDATSLEADSSEEETGAESIFRFESVPGGVSVWIDGTNRGQTPLDVSLRKIGSRGTVIYKKKGYMSREISFDAESSLQVSGALRRIPKKKTNKGASSSVSNPTGTIEKWDAPASSGASEKWD